MHFHDLCEQDRSTRTEIQKHRNCLKVWHSSNTSERPLKIKSPFVKKRTAYWILIIIATIWYSTFHLALGTPKIWKLQYWTTAFACYFVLVSKLVCNNGGRKKACWGFFGKRLVSEIFGPKMEGTGEDCIMSTFVMYSSINIIRVTQSKRINRRNMWHVWGKGKVGDLMERDKLEDLGVGKY